jgi:hypothetical protein
MLYPTTYNFGLSFFPAALPAAGEFVVPPCVVENQELGVEYKTS